VDTKEPLRPAARPQVNPRDVDMDIFTSRASLELSEPWQIFMRLTNDVADHVNLPLSGRF